MRTSLKLLTILLFPYAVKPFPNESSGDTFSTDTGSTSIATIEGTTDQSLTNLIVALRDSSHPSLPVGIENQQPNSDITTNQFLHADPKTDESNFEVSADLADKKIDQPQSLEIVSSNADKMPSSDSTNPDNKVIGEPGSGLSFEVAGRLSYTDSTSGSTPPCTSSSSNNNNQKVEVRVADGNWCRAKPDNGPNVLQQMTDFAGQKLRETGERIKKGMTNPGYNPWSPQPIPPRRAPIPKKAPFPVCPLGRIALCCLGQPQYQQRLKRKRAYEQDWGDCDLCALFKARLTSVLFGLLIILPRGHDRETCSLLRKIQSKVLSSLEGIVFRHLSCSSGQP